jgi:hypothetical protein
VGGFRGVEGHPEIFGGDELLGEVPDFR